MREVKIDFGNPCGEVKEYKFVVSLGEEKSAKFNTNNGNWMVSKTLDYFENTVRKIALICLPVIILAFFLPLIWANKRKGGDILRKK
ncbi:hypothetical protein [endosymbiont DhMRE of Dentiscutata heterogama]|uniref:hypothetical protein n=1 Tax=endosymbiont DhMRE of Dentiscutata heterogama TaxID=1609546 RepID=UPI002AD259F4|nr:hypothetical protein [endosymbiont DhMRE of Dentiscutata heterogama]